MMMPSRRPERMSLRRCIGTSSRSAHRLPRSVMGSLPRQPDGAVLTDGIDQLVRAFEASIAQPFEPENVARVQFGWLGAWRPIVLPVAAAQRAHHVLGDVAGRR